MGIPLLLTSVTALALIAERLFFFIYHHPKYEVLDKFLESDDWPKQFEDFLKNKPRDQLTNSPLFELLKVFHTHIHLEETKRQQVCETTFCTWLNRARGPIKHLSMLAQVAPLLGLTGTVLGLVNAFQVLEKSERMASPSLLAGGIWEALLTTIVGMLISIPLIILVRAFNHHVDKIVVAAKTFYTKLSVIPQSEDKLLTEKV